jgi:phosphatidate cytidylyltransferase
MMMAAGFDDTTLRLFAGTFGVLAAASLVGALLKWRVARGRPHGVIDNLNSRIKAWWVMVALIGVAFACGKAGVLLLFGLMSAIALREFLALTPTRAADRLVLALLFLLVLPVQYLLIWIEWYGLYSIFIPVYAFLVLPALATLRGDATRFLERTAQIQWGLMVCVFCLSHVPALLTLPVPGHDGRQLLLVGYLIIVVQGSDVLQYIWGKLLGRHKLAPELSPSKTVEGLIGGVASATALGAALYWITPFTPLQSAAMAFMICVMGFLGGLVMSAIKRDRGIKDWGTLIEGHGGMLDRLDSVVFAAPVYFHVVRYGWTP